MKVHVCRLPYHKVKADVYRLSWFNTWVLSVKGHVYHMPCCYNRVTANIWELPLVDNIVHHCRQSYKPGMNSVGESAGPSWLISPDTSGQLDYTTQNNTQDVTTRTPGNSLFETIMSDSSCTLHDFLAFNDNGVHTALRLLIPIRISCTV